MTPRRRLVLLRHGETDHNAGLRMQGQLDVELNAFGRAQAVAVARVLAKQEPELLVSSDLSRAADTARAAAELIGVDVHLDRRLREAHLGQWQGLTHAQVQAHTPGGMAAWRCDARYAPPGGEAKVEVAARAAAVVDELPDGPGTVLLVTHGGLITALTGRLLELPVERWSMLGAPDNAAWAQLQPRPVGGRPDWRLQAWNAGLGD